MHYIDGRDARVNISAFLCCLRFSTQLAHLRDTTDDEKLSMVCGMCCSTYNTTYITALEGKPLNDRAAMLSAFCAMFDILKRYATGD